MSTAPSAQDQFDDAASRQLEAVYLTPDVVEQRERVLALLAPKAGEHALDIGCGPGLTTQALAQAVGPQGSVLGVDIAPPAVKARLGNYPALARRTAAAIPGAQLVLFPELGHAPQIQDPQRFHRALLEALSSRLSSKKETQP